MFTMTVRDAPVAIAALHTATREAVVDLAANRVEITSVVHARQLAERDEVGVVVPFTPVTRPTDDTLLRRSYYLSHIDKHYVRHYQWFE